MVSFKPTKDQTIEIVLDKDEAVLLHQLASKESHTRNKVRRDFFLRLELVLDNAIEMNGQ